MEISETMSSKKTYSGVLCQWRKAVSHIVRKSELYSRASPETSVAHMAFFPSFPPEDPFTFLEATHVSSGSGNLLPLWCVKNEGDFLSTQDIFTALHTLALLKSNVRKQNKVQCFGIWSLASKMPLTLRNHTQTFNLNILLCHFFFCSKKMYRICYYSFGIGEGELKV